MVRPFFFGDVARYKPWKLSETIDDVYINVNAGREEEYGLLHFLRAAKELPSKRFHVFGISEFIPIPNVLYYGRIPEEQYDDITKDFDLYCMLHRNAGTSQSALKALMRGQRVVSNNRLSFDSHHVINWRELLEYINDPIGNFDDVPQLNQMDWL